MNYHTDTTAITKSMLSTFYTSREDYWHQYIACDVKRKPSKLMLAGSLAHAVLLEGHSVEDSIAIYPPECLTKAGSLHPTKAGEFRAENEGKLCLKLEDADEFFAMGDHLHKSELRVLFDGHHKETIFRGEHLGRKIKCKPDVCCVMDDHVVIYDLKFVQVADPEQFKRGCRSFTYWMQDAHYSTVLRSNYGLPVTFRFCAVETSYPFRINWYEYDARSREIALEKWERVLKNFIECERTGVWQDNHVHTLTLSPYEVEANEEGELEGCDEYSEV